MFTEDVRLEVYDRFRREGRAPARDEIAADLAAERADVDAGRLDRGYRRREPAAAAEYFREVGLRGSFWGLPE
jgi:hypothetical protein